MWLWLPSAWWKWRTRQKQCWWSNSSSIFFSIFFYWSIRYHVPDIAINSLSTLLFLFWFYWSMHLISCARYSYKVLYFQGSVTQTVRLSFAAQRYKSHFMSLILKWQHYSVGLLWGWRRTLWLPRLCQLCPLKNLNFKLKWSLDKNQV